MARPIIQVENLSKLYHVGAVRSKSLKEVGDRIWNRFSNKKHSLSAKQNRAVYEFNESQKGPEPNTFWALKDASFSVEQGEVIGIIGRNGAGKSTLLKILSRITEPTSGRAILRGRVASLLEVGTGFHPDLTGRENVYLNGAILGMRKREIDRKFDEIVAFAEVEKFIDTPVKHYSSGMYVRLAFAVAAHLDPEILLVDEVLAVGDVLFQKKCLGKMDEVAKLGRTVFFVSHNMAAIQQLTKKSILIHQGAIDSFDISSQAIERYMGLTMEKVAGLVNVENAPRREKLSQKIKFIKLSIQNNNSLMIHADEEITVNLQVRARDNIGRFRFSLTIYRSDSMPVGSFFGPQTLSIEAGQENTYQIGIKDHRLAPGKYYFSFGVGTGNNNESYLDYDSMFDVLNFEIIDPQHNEGTKMKWNFFCGAIIFEEPTIYYKLTP